MKITKETIERLIGEARKADTFMSTKVNSSTLTNLGGISLRKDI